MKKSVLAFLSSVLALVIVSTTMTAPAQAGPLDCSLGGSFFLTNGGRWLESSTSNCAGEVVIPASVTEIGPSAFNGRNITGVTFEEGSVLDWITGFARTNITSIVIPATTTWVSWSAFDRTPMTSLSIPGRVNSISDDALGANLETLILEPRIGTVSLGIGKFQASSKLSSIIVNGPSRVHAIGGGFVKEGMNFKGWSESVDGPLISFPHIVTAGNIKTLYPVFAPKVVQVYNCSLSGTFTTTDDVLTSATSNCAGEVTIPTAVTQVNDVFNGRAITSVLFPSDSRVTSFTSNALQNMPFTSIVLPPNMTSINGEAMRGNKLTSISYPGKLAGFGYNGLGPEVETITFESRIEPNYWIDNAFVARAINVRSITFNSAITWPAIKPNNKPLYEWLGWSATVDGPVLSFPRSVVGTIYPRWQPKVFTATFNSNGGNEAASTSSIRLGVIEQFPTPPTRAGYSFIGWFDNAGGSGNQVTQWMNESNPTFYAKWVINRIVNFDSQGGSAVSAGNWPQGGQISQAPVDPTRPGYTFAGWSRTASGAAVSFPLTPGGTADITLFAKWTANTNAVNFNSMGGSAVSPSSFVTDAAISQAPVDPTRPGYTFNGWSATEGGEAVTFPYSPAATSDITLFAKWTANTYLVNLSTNGGTSVPPGSFQTDGPIASALTEPFRPGYTFAGWSATDGGDAVAFPYSPGVIGNITLYAIWDANTYAVNLNTKGGSSVPALSFRADGAVSAAPATPIRAGYTLLGWSATDGGDAVSFPYAPDVFESITLYAIWDANTYAVNLNTNGGLTMPALSFRSDGVISSAPTTPVRVGYTFQGWSAIYDGAAVTFPYAPGVFEDITLYATWIRDPYKPELKANATVSGSGLQSTPLTAATGTWDAYPDAAVTVQWYRCDKAVAAGLSALTKTANCVLIAGATRESYKVVVPDAGKYLTPLVTAKNRIGTTVTTSRSFLAPKLAAPSRIKLPVVTGSAIAKQYLSATVGTWKSNPVAKTSTQWFRCEKATRATNAPVAESSDCTAIKGAKATRYRLVADDEGMFVTSQVTAVNTQGTVVVTASSPRVALTPSSTNSPVISGTAMVNKSLTASTGSWEAFPAPKTSVQWYRCGNDTSAGEKKFSGSSRCTPIRGATKNRYTVTAADKDKYISVLVTAVNTAGKTTVTAESAQVAYAPTKTANPSISGSASVDKTLTATPGRWSAFPEASTSFKWYRCSSPAAAGAEKFTGASGCSPIGGASDSRYTVTEADRGKYIAVLVKASNSAGSTSATSKSTSKVG